MYHFETKGTVDHEEDEVSNFPNVDHTVEVVAFNEGETAFLPLTTVTGPLTSFNICLVYRRTRLLSKAVLPTPGEPTMAMITGGGSSSGVRFTRGTCKRVWSCSTFRLP